MSRLPLRPNARLDQGICTWTAVCFIYRPGESSPFCLLSKLSELLFLPILFRRTFGSFQGLLCHHLEDVP